MKKVSLIILTLLTLCSGCSSKNMVTKFKDKIEGANSYYIDGVMMVVNGENTYTYDINVSYQKDEKYRVSLKNRTNDHEQIILKNDEGVYVLTPSLNKSFKFQSDWPYNNSQSYLLHNLLEDVLNDKDMKYKDGVITTKVNYPNNKELVKQKIYLDKDANIKKVEVLNSDGIVKIKMNYNKLKLKQKFNKNYFTLDENMQGELQTTMKELDNAYPMYIPSNTYLEKEESVSLNDGERVILTFSGDKPFTLIEETVNTSSNSVIPVYGDLEVIGDVMGSLDDGTVSWISNGVEYFAISDALSKEEILKVASSVSMIPVGK